MKTSSSFKTNPLFLTILALGFFALSPKARAVFPPPDGGYAGFNTAEGQNALSSLTTGSSNTAIGWFSLFSNTDGSFNTAVGAGALLFNVGDQNIGEGIENTAIGTAALLNNTAGHENTATGVLALFNNTIGIRNTATGFQSLNSNTEGIENTAIGFNALHDNNTGNDNTATGFDALFSNTTGNKNTAIGDEALLLNTTGVRNTATGSSALFTNTTGGGNTALGESALFGNSTGDDNIAIGHNALSNNVSGSANIGIGLNAGANVSTASNVICIGAIGADEDNGCFIGNIFGQTSSGGGAVFVNAEGKLGTTPSSRRFKDDIKPMENASQALFALKPVTFHYKSDHANTPQFGLIAEEVAEVNPDLVLRDKNGEIYTLRYDVVNVMLLNEFLKEHKTVQELKKEVATLIARLKEQNSIQKVSDQMEVRQPALRMTMSRP